MNDLRKLLELNPEYPPTEQVWRQILALCSPRQGKKLTGLDKVRYSLMMETQALEQSGNYSNSTMTDGTGLSFKPQAVKDPAKIMTSPALALPEPAVVRFYYKDEPYYLDVHDQIYQADADQPLVGNLVGQIKDGQVTINDKVVTRLATRIVKSKEIHGREYYLGTGLEAYRGMLPGKRYLCLVGQLNQKGKLELILE